MRAQMIAGAILALSAATAVPGGSPAQTAPPSGNADRGHQLFLADGCYECHGTVGQGGAAGPRIAPNPLSAEAIMAYVRRPAGQMPPYSAKVLSDNDIRDIHAYLAGINNPGTGGLQALIRKK